MSKQDEAHWNVLKTSGAIALAGASIAFTGGTAGWALLAIDAAVLSSDTYSRYYDSHHQQNDYIAGVGNLSEFNQAKSELDDFVFWTALDAGLFAIGGLGEVIEVASKLRRTRLLTESIGDASLTRRLDDIESSLARTSKQDLVASNRYKPEYLDQLDDYQIIQLRELDGAGRFIDNIDDLNKAIRLNEISDAKILLKSSASNYSFMGPDELKKLERLSDQIDSIEGSDISRLSNIFEKINKSENLTALKRRNFLTHLQIESQAQKVNQSVRQEDYVTKKINPNLYLYNHVTEKLCQALIA